MRNVLLGLLLASPITLAAPPKLISAEGRRRRALVPEQMHLQSLPGKAVVVSDPETGRMYGVKGAASWKAGELGLDSLKEVRANNSNNHRTQN